MIHNDTIGASLLIMACPYCGSSDVHETNRVEGHCVETVAIWCCSCDEECNIDRNLDRSGEAGEQ